MIDTYTSLMLCDICAILIRAAPDLVPQHHTGGLSPWKCGAALSKSASNKSLGTTNVVGNL